MWEGNYADDLAKHLIVLVVVDYYLHCQIDASMVCVNHMYIFCIIIEDYLRFPLAIRSHSLVLCT
jgi:hypothetical protein